MNHHIHCTIVLKTNYDSESLLSNRHQTCSNHLLLANVNKQWLVYIFRYYIFKNCANIPVIVNIF